MRGHMNAMLDITRPERALCDRLAAIGTATASSELSFLTMMYGSSEITSAWPLMMARVGDSIRSLTSPTASEPTARTCSRAASTTIPSSSSTGR